MAGRDVAFVIGGPDGLAPTLADNADLHLAFGALTWPHQLVRIMLLEQIYRAVTILSGHPYHRAISEPCSPRALATGILRGRHDTSARITAAAAART